MSDETDVGLLAAFDEQVRRDPAVGGADVVQSGVGVVRTRSAGDGWNGITWSDLGRPGRDVDEVIAEQVRWYAENGVTRWEWKYYSYDRPADLPQRLTAAGFVAEETEALLVARIADLDLDVVVPEGVRLVDVRDAAGAEALVTVHDEVFGGDHAELGRHVLDGLREQPHSIEAVVAMAGQVLVCAGRVELPPGREFASIWGGGTLAAWRGRGVFRAVVAHRAAAAAGRGYRYLQVDASPDSRPILRRLGFAELATTVPFRYGPER